MFTASSVCKNAYSRNGGIPSQSSQDWAGDSLKSEEEVEREIIQNIEENLTISDSPKSRLVTRNPQLRAPVNKKIFRDMYLITEIESDFEMSKESLKDVSMDSATAGTSPQKS